MSEKKLSFIVEWYDTQSSVIRKYNFTYYTRDEAIELFDLKNHKLFLKKTYSPDFKLSEVFIGAVIMVFGRQLKFMEYADVFTKNYFESQQEKTFAMIKPDAYLNIGKIINEIENSGFVIGNIRMTKMSENDAGDFYAEHKGKGFYDGLVKQMSSDLIVGIELIAENAVKKWRDVMGPTDPNKARNEAPNSLRAKFGQAGPKNSTHGSDSKASADRELNFFFHENSQLKTTATLDNCSLLIIKPHIVKSRQVGKIIDQVLTAGFEISALQMFYLDYETATEFYKVYKGVLPEYTNLAEHLTIGPSIALEIRNENPVTQLRELCGPFDPAIAQVLRPDTIRSKFGVDRVKNAVHCTDLEEDGRLEVGYFFKTLMVPGWARK